MFLLDGVFFFFFFSLLFTFSLLLLRPNYLLSLFFLFHPLCRLSGGVDHLILPENLVEILMTFKHQTSLNSTKISMEKKIRGEWEL